MKIGEIINKITDAIIHFRFENITNGTKIVVLVFAILSLLIIFFGFLFSLIPQF